METVLWLCLGFGTICVLFYLFNKEEWVIAKKCGHKVRLNFTYAFYIPHRKVVRKFTGHQRVEYCAVCLKEYAEKIRCANCGRHILLDEAGIWACRDIYKEPSKGMIKLEEGYICCGKFSCTLDIMGRLVDVCRAEGDEVHPDIIEHFMRELGGVLGSVGRLLPFG